MKSTEYAWFLHLQSQSRRCKADGKVVEGTGIWDLNFHPLEHSHSDRTVTSEWNIMSTNTFITQSPADEDRPWRTGAFGGPPCHALMGQTQSGTPLISWAGRDQDWFFATGHLAFLKRHGWAGGRGVLSATAVRYRIELKFPLCVDFCWGIMFFERVVRAGGRSRGGGETRVFVRSADREEERERGYTGRKERHSSMKRASVL